MAPEQSEVKVTVMLSSATPTNLRFSRTICGDYEKYPKKCSADPSSELLWTCVGTIHLRQLVSLGCNVNMTVKAYLVEKKTAVVCLLTSSKLLAAHPRQ